MRFWDTSALVPLLLEQEASATVRGFLDEDRAMAAWWGTPVECASVAARLRRAGSLSVTDEQEVLRLLGTLRASWLEILPSDEVRDEAMRLLRVHALRAADALQLAAAALLAGGGRSEVALVTFDERLALAARLEGFEVLPSP